MSLKSDGIPSNQNRKNIGGNSGSLQSRLELTKVTSKQFQLHPLSAPNNIISTPMRQIFVSLPVDIVGQQSLQKDGVTEYIQWITISLLNFEDVEVFG